MNLVALGSKYGKIYIYEFSHYDSQNITISAILAHHSSQVHNVLFNGDQIISCSDDMTIGIVTILSDSSLILTRILQGHVSRVKIIQCLDEQILSGSDDRTVKLWNSKRSSKALNTFGGHCGPITALLLAKQVALSASGSTVRLWDVKSGTCLKLLQNNGCVTCLAWVPAIDGGIFTLDTQQSLRSYSLQVDQEILEATSLRKIPYGDNCTTFSHQQQQQQLYVKMEAIPQQVFVLTLSTDPCCCNPCSIAMNFIDFSQ